MNIPAPKPSCRLHTAFRMRGLCLTHTPYLRHVYIRPTCTPCCASS
jgi:hypothetical protein